MFKHDLVLSACKNKAVLHVGATDSPYHLEKAEKGVLLHQRLQIVSKNLIGIDIDKKAIEELKSYFGIDNIYYGDVVKGTYEIDIGKFNFEIIVFSDVIEHLDCPIKALKNLKNLMGNGTKLIMTAPNAFSYHNLINIIRGIENVHPDHKFWTSSKTLHQLVDNAGLKIERLVYCRYGHSSDYPIRSKFFNKTLFSWRKDLLPAIFAVVSRREV